VQTYPYPDADPDIGLWLHGLGDKRSVDVNLVWRADLSEALLGLDEARPAVSLVTACRPGSGEAISVPIEAVREWLARLADDKRTSPRVPVADVEGVVSDGHEDVRSGRTVKPALRWGGDKSDVARDVRDIRPGDTLIVPAAYGGLSARNWDPDDLMPVPDFGHRVEAEQRRRATLRLNPAVLMPEIERLPKLPCPAVVDADGEIDDFTAVDDWLAHANKTSDGESLTGRIVAALRHDRRRVVLRVRVGPTDDPASSVFVVSSRRRLPVLEASQESLGETVDSEPDTSSFTGTATGLHDHLRDVEKWARAVADACGLSADLADDLALAGRLHDVGKSDPRFQAMLRQGRITGDGMLAKSAVPAGERAERERARREAGYPSGGRHELLSVAMVQHAPELAALAHDWDLVLHLVASHHGFCRPFAPVVHDPIPVNAELLLDGCKLGHSTVTHLARIDAGVADRFWSVIRRYGWFGLAELEAILRLADHRASAAEQIQVRVPDKELCS
jgi:CRISPR-associated endonuclease/helicase Cas3